MAYYTIPLKSVPETFDITMPLARGNKDFRLTLEYNYTGDYWMLGIFDPATGSPYITNLALLPGKPDYNILRDYAYFDIGTMHVVKVSDVVQGHPTENSFESDFVLVWGDGA